MKIRYATREDLLAWYGNVPATMRALVVENEGRIVGVAGVGRMGDHLQAFSSFTEELRGHKVTLGRAAIAFKKMLTEYQGPVLAICSQSEPTAPALLERLGFVPVQERLWRHG